MDALTEYLMPLLEAFFLFIPKLIVALLVFIVSLYFSGLARRTLKRVLEQREVDPELSILLQRTGQWTVITVGTIVALQQVDFDLTAFLTGLGIIGFTIGFAIQDVSKNFIAGILLLLQQPFDIGDAIEVNGYTGTVTDINIRATEMRTLDGVPVVIPNGDVYVSIIKNYTRTDRRRLELQLGVAYDSDLNLVTETVQNALAGIAGVDTGDSAPQVVFKTFGDSSIELTAYFWIDLNEIGYFDAEDQSIKAVKTACEQAGIEIPFPIRTLLLPQGNGGELKG